MKQREDTIRKWFSLWLDSREAELSDLFTEDAAYIESWGPEYYGREMIARWFRDWHRSGQVLRWDIQEFLNSENTTVHCLPVLYQIGYKSSKQCLWRAICESPHFCESGNEGFLLVEALSQSPQNTILCPGNAGKFQRLRDFANR